MRAQLPFLTVILALFAPFCMHSRAPGDPVEHVGGTVAGLPRASGLMDLTGRDALRFRTGRSGLDIPYEDINVVEYGQKVNRRYLEAVVISPLFLLAKKRQHFVTIGFTDAEGRQQAVVFRVNKDHIRAVLVGLEAKTGRKVQFQDPEARKAGKN